MFKKFLNGLIFGTGAAIALIVVFAIAPKLFFSSRGEGVLPEETVIGEAPSIAKPAGFLGSSGRFNGHFSGNSSVLSSGDGAIT